MREENDRVLHCLHSSTRKPLIAILEQTLLSTYQDAILDKGFDSLMDQNSRDDLAHLYKLYACIGALELLQKHFRAYIMVRRRVQAAVACSAVG